MANLWRFQNYSKLIPSAAPWPVVGTTLVVGMLRFLPAVLLGLASSLRAPAAHRAALTAVRVASSAEHSDPILGIPRLEAALVEALDGDEAAVAALSEELSCLRLSAEMGVLSANAAFYEAFSEASPERMRALWSDSDAATCAHPGHPLLLGAADVAASWRAIFSGGGTPKLSCGRQRVVLRGNVAWVTCTERAGDGDDAAPSLEALNIFEREQGRWILVHHGASPVFVQ